MAKELTYNYSGVINMSVNTNILAEKFVFSPVCLFAFSSIRLLYTESITELVVYEHKHCELQKFAYIVLVIKYRSTRP